MMSHNKGQAQACFILTCLIAELVSACRSFHSLGCRAFEVDLKCERLMKIWRNGVRAGLIHLSCFSFSSQNFFLPNSSCCMLQPARSKEATCSECMLIMPKQLFDITLRRSTLEVPIRYASLAREEHADSAFSASARCRERASKIANFSVRLGGTKA